KHRARMNHEQRRRHDIRDNCATRQALGLPMEGHREEQDRDAQVEVEEAPAHQRGMQNRKRQEERRVEPTVNREAEAERPRGDADYAQQVEAGEYRLGREEASEGKREEVEPKIRYQPEIGLEHLPDARVGWRQQYVQAPEMSDIVDDHRIGMGEE